MKVHIHRGQNQIGGSVIEIFTDTTRIFFDVGANMNDAKAEAVPPVEGLFFGKRNADAVFLTHYHADHVGLLGKVISGIPVYMGKTAYEIFKVGEAYRNHLTAFRPRFVSDQEKIVIGDITVTPFRCDHSAYDAYMYLAEADGERILYTGDFRSHGRLDFEKLIHSIPEVDILITEGTSLSRDLQDRSVFEDALIDMGKTLLKDRRGPVFVVMSPMNIDRLVTCYQIAYQTGRTFLVDPYAAELAKAVRKEAAVQTNGCQAPVPGKDPGIRVFWTDGSMIPARLRGYGKAGISMRGIRKEEKFLMCVRPGMKQYLHQLSGLVDFHGGTLIYSMFAGHLELPYFSSFMDFMERKGLERHVLHTSGHADPEAIDQLILKVKPKTILPVHTENAGWFSRYEPECRVIV